MKKNEMDKLRELVKIWKAAIYSPCHSSAGVLNDLLDTFEVEPEFPEPSKVDIGTEMEAMASDFGGGGHDPY